MPHKRDGPAPQGTTPGPGKDERALVLPRPHFSRKPFPPARDPSQKPSTIRRRQRRQGGRWRGFAVRLYVRPGPDAAHALYAFLKLAAQRYGLEVGEVQEIHDNSST
jgi:hypothetical protein